MDLTFEETTSKFSNLIHFVTRKYIPNSQAYDRNDFYQDSLIVLYKCWNRYRDKPIEEFKTIFSVSLKRLLCNKIKKGNLDSNQVSYNNLVQLDDGEISDSEYEDSKGKLDDNLNNIYVQEGLLQLQELLSGNIVASAILEELLSPSDRTIWELNMDKARKKMLHDQGHSEVRVTRSMNLRMHHIARSLGISINDLNKGLKEIREQAYNVFK
jgi:hypothetical protein